MIFEVVGAVAAALLTVLLLPLCIRPRAPRRPVPSPLPSGTQPFAAGDAASLAAALSECVRCPTVAAPSQQQPTAQPSEPFRRLHRVLGDRFPRAHTQLQRHTVSGAALLYVWKGRDASLRPVLLTAHQDVVPSGDDAAWTHPPFAGDVDGDGWLWGRGAVDDKCCVVCILAAVERLLSCGFVPERTVLLAFGCNEEVNADATNPKSAVQLARKIEEEGLAPLEAVLDEGGIIYPIPKSLGGGDGGHVAMVGIAEKGSACFRVAAAPPDCAGHSSMPPQTSAAGALAKAILAIEQNPAPSTLTFALPLINALKHKAPAAVRLLASWPRSLGWLLRAALSKTRATNALLRTTRSVTVISGGDRFNVLPATASAIVNARLMPGTSSSEELAALRKTVAHIPGVTVELLHEQGVAEATTTTKAEGWAWDALVRSVEAVFPGVPVSPFLCIAMTDSRFYRGICDNVLMLEPIVDDYGAAALMHNIDERIPIAALPRMANLYLHFIVETSQQAHC